MLRNKTPKLIAGEEWEERNKLPVATADYTTGSVKRACDILKSFDSEHQILRLDEITQKVGLPKPTVYRLLYTLAECGMIERRGKNLYALGPPWREKKVYRIGYASQSEEFSFSRLVRDSIHRNAYEAGIEIIFLDNRYSPTRALQNAKTFVANKVDLVIEFQVHQGAASDVAATLAAAGIPLIAIDIPHPGAYFYGANNYRAGWMGGHYLAQCCQREWGGHCDELILMGLPIAGDIPQTRMTGTLAGVREVLLPKLREQNVISLNGNGRYESSLELVRKHLRKSQSKNVLIAGINDPSSLGALHAFREAGRAENCLVVGQNAGIEARREIRMSDSRMVGSVAYFPEHYGEAIIAFAFDILAGKDVPPTMFVTHKMVKRSNVDELYPNDSLIPLSGADSLLFSSR